VTSNGSVTNGSVTNGSGASSGAGGAVADRPAEVRHLATPAALALADLAGVFDDLQTVLNCCERLMAQLARPGPAELASPLGEPDDLALEAYWTTAVLAYGRCFAAGARGIGLTTDDVTETGLPGDVVGWHKVLEQIRGHYADPAVNPRESFSVGATRDASGAATGIAVTSTPRPRLDDVTVRQTGALAYELTRIVDNRIAEQQKVIFTALQAMSGQELDALPLLEIVEPPGEQASTQQAPRGA